MLRFYFVRDRQIDGKTVKAGTVLMEGEQNIDCPPDEINSAVADGDVRVAIVSGPKVRVPNKKKAKG